ncbi:MAG: 16S rRNA (adenine(1518)-N(6)/adenine(1519)-N(6))-dimethyltransferase RsmA [Nitrospirota bacterium]|nr:16S rRNA (adenine(1518)-N(6)/adenine(1519)-N(6))-dimethyltransferase RsmA [Nitrospirota bacterium]
MLKRKLGQHYLFDTAILKRLIEAADLAPEDTVVEIGPGKGILTLMLSEEAREVVAIELDPYLCEHLKKKVSAIRNINLFCVDALKYPYHTLPPFKVVANIPYYITTPIIFRLLAHRDRLISATLTVQKEVAERIVAPPGGKDYGVLSLMVQYYADTNIAFFIPKEAFKPPPKVDSAVVHLRILAEPRISVPDERLFFRVIKTAFSQRRKTLSNSLKPLAEDIKDILSAAGIDPRRRPETLSMEEFAGIAEAISAHKKN